MPIAVAENKVGNRSELERNTKLKVLEVPILANIMKTGMKLVKECRNIIIRPPTRVKLIHMRNAILTSYFS
jgi:hypothetical protein